VEETGLVVAVVAKRPLLQVLLTQVAEGEEEIIAKIVPKALPVGQELLSFVIPCLNARRMNQTTSKLEMI
jgi:hypothetical protein